jgi:hypothetical protein
MLHAKPEERGIVSLKYAQADVRTGAVRQNRFRFSPESGPVAQLGARVNGIHEVTGSIPVWSTKSSFPASIGRKYVTADRL